MDKTSIEVFYNEGETVMTELFFPNKPFETLSIHTSDEKLLVKDLKIEEFQFN
jgi:levanase/fructan beta-fructosidase